MGTRSLTVFRDEPYTKDGECHEGQEIVVMYRQMDGYPSGHGQELAKFLAGTKLINGIPVGQDVSKCFNGMACLAARVINHFKKGEIGNLYLHPAGTRDCWEQYIYEVSGETGREPIIKCFDARDKKVLHCGSASQVLAEITEVEKRPQS